ncbi:MAG TPA: hypothetical protein DHU16_07490 [Gammaproteobacteria bacterium]|nr:hypothetical protein [Gammaproteobacteria bacterium]
MQLTYRGSVNRWECDENDHLNVRFCEEKLWQTLVSGLLQLGAITEGDVDELPARIACQHLRFQQESRVATPISGFLSVLPDDVAGQFNILVQLRHGVSDEPLCSCLFLVDGLDCETAEISPSAIAHALPKGVELDLPYHVLDLSGALEKGFVVTGRGVIQRNECTSNGLSLPHNYMARTSDSMPNLWTHLAGDERVSDAEGGAVVEFRRQYHEPLRANQAFTVVSGLLSAQGKIQRFGHMLFNAGTRACCASAQVIAVRMDLNARKAIALSDEDLVTLLHKQVQPL